MGGIPDGYQNGYRHPACSCQCPLASGLSAHVGEGLRVGDEDENENSSGCDAGDHRLFRRGMFSHADNNRDDT